MLGTCSARERAERGREPLVGQQRRKDPACDLAEVVQRDVVRSLSRSSDASHAVGIRDDARRVVPDLVSDRRDLGADTVPELLLEAVPLRVAHRDEAFAGPPELLGLRREFLRPMFEVDRQPGVLESDPGMRREILEQRSLGRPEGIADDFAIERSPIGSPACSIGSVRSGSPTSVPDGHVADRTRSGPSGPGRNIRTRAARAPTPRAAASAMSGSNWSTDGI